MKPKKAWAKIFREAAARIERYENSFSCCALAGAAGAFGEAELFVFYRWLLDLGYHPYLASKKHRIFALLLTAEICERGEL